MARQIKTTTITGYKMDRTSAPADADERMVWAQENMVSTYRAGHWNIASCEVIAAKMGIVDGLQIKHH